MPVALSPLQEAARWFEAGELDRAEAQCHRLRGAERHHPDALYLLGMIARARGENAAALGLFNACLAHAPGHASARAALGTAFDAAGRTEEALTAWRQACASSPGHTDAWIRLGNRLSRLGRHDEALATFERALDHQPANAEAWMWRGSALCAAGRIDDGGAAFRRAVRLRPSLARAWYLLALVERDRLALAEAEACLHQALDHDPGHVLAHCELANLRLIAGDVAGGLAEMEWRWRRPGLAPRVFPMPAWDGDEPAGRRILVHAEQGAGDALMFARFVPRLAARGARVTLACHPGLERLLATVDGVERTIPLFAEPAGAFDRHVPLMSLPRLLGVTADTLPARVPYLRAPSGPTLPAAPGRLKVGVVWAGNPRADGNRHRSIPITALAAWRGLDGGAPEDARESGGESNGVAFYSLQMGRGALDLGHWPLDRPPVDLRPRIRDFADTAALLEQLDLVVSVDTSVAHLAGALGRPTWVLPPLVPPDWRWLVERGDSPWYPTVRLFRPAIDGDWETPLRQVRHALDRALAVSR